MDRHRLTKTLPRWPARGSSRARRRTGHRNGALPARAEPRGHQAILAKWAARSRCNWAAASATWTHRALHRRGLRYVINGTPPRSRTGCLKDTSSPLAATSSGASMQGRQGCDRRMEQVTGTKSPMGKKSPPKATGRAISTTISRSRRQASGSNRGDGRGSSRGYDPGIPRALSNMADIEQLSAVASDGVEGVICWPSDLLGRPGLCAAQRRADELTGA